MNTWYIYSPSDTDEDGTRLMLDWGLGYQQAINSASANFHETGKITRIADEWFDTQILGPELDRLGVDWLPNRRSADPRTSPGLWPNDALARLAADLGR